jgi:hypothetical protein
MFIRPHLNGAIDETKIISGLSNDPCSIFEARRAKHRISKYESTQNWIFRWSVSYDVTGIPLLAFNIAVMERAPRSGEPIAMNAI